MEKTYEYLLFLCVAEYVGEDGDDPELVELGGQLRAEAQHPQAERQLVLDLKHIRILSKPGKIISAMFPKFSDFNDK